MLKFCKKCNCETERGYLDGCKPCRRKYNIDNKEKIAETSKLYYLSNKERLSDIGKEYYLKNKDKIIARNLEKKEELAEKRRIYNLANKEHRAEYNLANKEKRANKRLETKLQKAEYDKKYKLENPEVRINSYTKRRANMSTGKLSKGIIQKLYQLQKGLCICCNYPLGDDYHLDHIMPLKLGGTHTDDNVQLLRSLCNMQKKAKHPIDFMQEKGYLL